MILDSSALVAIALDEPDRQGLLDAINAADHVGVAAPTLVEAGIVLSSRTGRDAGEQLTKLVDAADAIIIEFGADHWREAISAFWRFGKGRHRARLSFGDCLAYAAARLAEQPLLATGNDFEHTDIGLVRLLQHESAESDREAGSPGSAVGAEG